MENSCGLAPTTHLREETCIMSMKLIDLGTGVDSGKPGNGATVNGKSHGCKDLGSEWFCSKAREGLDCPPWPIAADCESHMGLFWRFKGSLRRHGESAASSKRNL